jgi:hypothetical protein
MLWLHGSPFTTGSVRFDDSSHVSSEPTAKVYVPFRLASLEGTFQAMLDTGAAWSMLEREVAADAGLFEQEGEELMISTRLGPIRGKLVRAELILSADQGDSLSMGGTVFISESWEAGSFLGYNGLLERLRIALAPEENRFFFGPAVP